uniref:Transmembrane protein 26 n=1 Tax=Seriola dumerili TaxID=41447 RepID=A0A3B4URB9_SERDU
TPEKLQNINHFIVVTFETLLTKQTMLIVLVLGRWLMPKGDMSRDQLSQLLMVYVGLGADILDIFDTFREPEVKTNRAVVIVGLALFSWALMQFPLVLTQTRPSKGESGGLLCCPGAPPSFASCCSSEVWSLLLTVGLQDGPFLLYRLYLMVQEQVLNQLMIFFTCKNILIVLLELYRIFVRCAALVLWCRAQGGGEVEEEKQEDTGREERCGEQSCHSETETGTEREEDHRGVQVQKSSKCREA